MQHDISNLPIQSKKQEIIDAVTRNRVVIISGETGSGKTTQIPKFLRRAGQGENGIIGCTQPRRIAAVTVAARIAEELGEPIGATVGYKIRFDNLAYEKCRIKIMTDGILLAEAQSDRFLKAYDTIIVDEAHERSLNIDFTLGILRQLVKKRKDLKVVITSATIDTEKFSRAFESAPVIEVSGRMYPVEVQYRPVGESDTEHDEDEAYVEAAADAVGHILKIASQGDILVFMPTEQDIGETMELIRARDIRTAEILPLFARLPAKEQQRVFSSGPMRRVVVATNVAETSITIPGIKYVVDTGLARIPSYSPRTRTTALPVRKISQSSADQRAGRCGRVANGVCIRLYSEDDFGARPYFTSPEILRSNLAEVILRMISLRLSDVSSFPFVDPPDSKSVKDGYNTLLELGAIKEKWAGKGKRREKVYALTKNGRVMARIPVDPKLSRILIEAEKRMCLDEAVVITAALSIADPRQRPMEKIQQADQKHGVFRDPSSDFVSYRNIWKAYQRARKEADSRSKLRQFCSDHFLSFRRMREWEDIQHQIRRVLKEHLDTGSRQKDRGAGRGKGKDGNGTEGIYKGTRGLKAKEYEVGGPVYTALHKSILSGYLANIARKKEKQIYTAAKGQQVMIFPGSGLFKKAPDWILASEFVHTSRLFARTVAHIDPAWIEEVGRSLCTYTYFSPRYEKKRGEVVAREQVSLFGLVIVEGRDVSYGKVNPSESSDIFIRNVLVEGETDKVFPFMAHNREMIRKVESLEDKTRTRGIMVSDEDIFLFYRNRLEKDFYNIRTFERYLKETGDDFLRMTEQDLVKAYPDEKALEGFPDKIGAGAGEFRLAYRFSPGSEKDGVTVKVPVSRADSLDPRALEKLVPGLFEEKVAALIKNLPKRLRKKMVPVHEKAKIIAEEMPLSDTPLFTLLSDFVKHRFGIVIPAAQWSEENLDAHLKMRISVRDNADREIASSRDRSIVRTFSETPSADQDLFRKEKERVEREDIKDWDVGDISNPIVIDEKDGISFKVFPGLAKEGNKVSLRLYRSYDAFLKGHAEGVRALYLVCFQGRINALKKDLKGAPVDRKHISRFMTPAEFKDQMFDSITRELFSKDIRTRKAFHDHAGKVLPDLYTLGQEFITHVVRVFEAYEETAAGLKELGTKCLNKPQLKSLMERLHKELSDILPKNFLELYTHDTIRHLPRYMAAVRIRAHRAFNDPLKDKQKAMKIEKYEGHLKTLVENLSSDSSREKAQKVEAFFWLLQEYKISVFAQEIKTDIRVSPKKLDEFISEIAAMI